MLSSYIKPFYPNQVTLFVPNLPCSKGHVAGSADKVAGAKLLGLDTTLQRSSTSVKI